MRGPCACQAIGQCHAAISTALMHDNIRSCQRPTHLLPPLDTQSSELFSLIQLANCSTDPQPLIISFSVTSSAGTPSGTVTVSDGTDSCTVAVSAGSCAMIFATAGDKTLTATYSGDDNFDGSVSASALHRVVEEGEDTTYPIYVPLIIR